MGHATGDTSEFGENFGFESFDLDTFGGFEDEFTGGPGSRGSDLAGEFGSGFDGGGDLFGDLGELFRWGGGQIEDFMKGSAISSIFTPLGFPFLAEKAIAFAREQGWSVVDAGPGDVQDGDGGVTITDNQGRTAIVSNAGIQSSDIPEIEAEAGGSGQGFDISSLEGTFVPLGGGSGFNIDDLPPLVDPSTLTPGSEEALRAELAAITRASFEVSLEQRDLQRALLPQILRGAGANPILDDSGSLIGFEVPKGGFPVPPGIERDIASGRATRREQLRRQLGPGFETSSSGIEALEEFELASTIARDMGRSSSLGRIQSALGLPIQSTQNIQGTGGGATSSLNAILGRGAIDSQNAFNNARLALAGQDDDDLFGTIFGGLASGFGRGFGGAAFGRLFP